MTAPISYSWSVARSPGAPHAFGMTATLNQAVSPLRFVFVVTRGRADLPVRIPFTKGVAHRLPQPAIP